MDVEDYSCLHKGYNWWRVMDLYSALLMIRISRSCYHDTVPTAIASVPTSTWGGWIKAVEAARGGWCCCIQQKADPWGTEASKDGPECCAFAREEDWKWQCSTMACMATFEWQRHKAMWRNACAAEAVACVFWQRDPAAQAKARWCPRHLQRLDAFCWVLRRWIWHCCQWRNRS